jgi:hypothetical protein
MSDISSGFPRNLAYNLKKLDAGFSKTKVKIIPDNNTNSVKENGIIRFRIVGNGLYDFRTLCMYFKGTASKTGGNPVHFPRYSASMIENLSITANNTTLCSINGYNLLYNTLMDLEGSDVSQLTKRNVAGERHDPTVLYEMTHNATNQTISATSTVLNGSASDSGVVMCVNNWVGFLGSLSTPIVDLSDWGDIYINIQFAPTYALWCGANADTTTTDGRATGVSYSLENIFLTIDRCSFQDPLYYSLKTEKLLSPAGLNVAYYDYYNAQFGKQQKSSTGISLNFTVNSPSLDQVIMTCRHLNYQDAVYPLVLYGTNQKEATNNRTFKEVLFGAPTIINDVGTLANAGFIDNVGDAFCQSLYFMRAGASIKGSKFSINSIDIDPYQLTDLEIFNKVLQYTGFQNLDMGSAGLHAGCFSLQHFNKYYWCDICDLTNISGDNQFWICGLDGRGSGINIAYSASFESGNSDNIFPVAYCRSTRVLKINAGRQLVLDPV